MSKERRSGTASGQFANLVIPIKVIGCGKFSEIVALRRKADNSLIVWREIDVGESSEDEKQRCVQEIQKIVNLIHTNIIQYFNPFVDDTNLCFEMEYLDGGTLHQKIMSKNSPFPESEVLWYFYQLMSALEYAYNKKMIHRNINSLNIFLSLDGLLKLGNFGLTKVISNTAATPVDCSGGIPYYMSPEVASRKERYNAKSDIWGCGCVLYEILSLQKVFLATDMIKLTVAVSTGVVDDLDAQYSNDIKEILHQTLQKETNDRPTAKEILEKSLFQNVKIEFDKKADAMGWVVEEEIPEETDGKSDRKSSAPVRRVSMAVLAKQASVAASEINEVHCWGGGKPLPQKIETFSEDNAGFDVSVGRKHFAVVTENKEVYTWANIVQEKKDESDSEDEEDEQPKGPFIQGQLGHGDSIVYISPKKIEFFTGMPVKQVSCGEDFTAILMEDGALYMTGSDRDGCIGCDRSSGNEVLLPRKVERLEEHKIVQIGCGSAHVVALTDAAEVFTWGRGQYGRLGLGSEDDAAVPEVMPMPPNCTEIVSIQCGLDNTMLLTDRGHVIGCGSNQFNKMALKQRVSVHGKSQGATNDFRTSPLPIRALKAYRIVQISAGKSHTAVIDIDGRVVTFGANEFGQLGDGDYKRKGGACVVKGPLEGKTATKVACGDGFTVASTSDNNVYAWGLGQNGRLGIDPGLLGEKGCCSVPRRVFPNLQKTVSIASGIMTTIIVTQKVCNVADKMNGSNDDAANMKIRELEVENAKLKKRIKELET